MKVLTTSRRETLGSLLERLVGCTHVDLRRLENRRGLLRGLAGCWSLLPLVPGLFLLLLLGCLLLGLPRPPLGFLLLALMTLLPPVGFLLFHLVAAAWRELDPMGVLATVDRELGSEERLVTAARFLALEDPSPFMQAAMLDAKPYAQKALALPLIRELPRFRMRRQDPLLALLSVGLLLLGAWIPLPGTPASRHTTGPAQRLKAQVTTSARSRRKSPNHNTKTSPPKPPPPQNRPLSPPKEDKAASSLSQRQTVPLTRKIKRSLGSEGEGKAADARASSGSGNARGTPSDQGQSGRANPKQSTQKSKANQHPARRQERAPTKKTRRKSGATAGKGSASGSNKSPAASTWSSRDQVVSEEEKEIEADEDVDDEFDNSEARGGVQPRLRDRKPPVNRDLGMGFGNQKDPDANGRGGRSELKKSRGVASLILGVPIPDHVKGRPNPGLTKITQERVEPRPSTAPARAARSQRGRRAPSGPLARPHIQPWMQRLLKAYFRRQNPFQPAH